MAKVIIKEFWGKGKGMTKVGNERQKEGELDFFFGLRFWVDENEGRSLKGCLKVTV